MLLSIAIPTYNRAFYLDKNLNELFKQYRNNFQVIVQDNASNDNTPNVVNKYKKMGLPIVYEINEKNLGWSKNFEICFKKVKTDYVILLGDDDVIIDGGINTILKNIRKSNPDLIFMKAFAFNNYNFKKNKKENYGDLLNLESFLYKSILQFRLMSSYVFKTKYIKNVNDYSGNFAHLHVVFEILNKGNSFMLINEKLIACFKNNSDFDNKVNFSDIYVKEFFQLFRKYLINKISKDSMEIIENIMLKKYFPKVILKSKFGLIKKDNLIKQNFDLIFEKNKFYKKNRAFYIENNLTSLFFLTFIIVCNIINR